MLKAQNVPSSAKSVQKHWRIIYAHRLEKLTWASGRRTLLAWGSAGL